MRLVILESPFAGDTSYNLAYAAAAMRDSLKRGEAPFASHILYTQTGILDDNDPAERRQGIDAGCMWSRHADATVVYADLGITKGMSGGIAHATASRRTIEYRYLPKYALVRVERLRFLVDALRAEKEEAAMADDRAWSNGTLARYDRDIAAARAALAEAMEAHAALQPQE